MRPIDGFGNRFDACTRLPAAHPKIPVFRPGEVAEAADLAEEFGAGNCAYHDPVAESETFGAAVVIVSYDLRHPFALVESILDVSHGRHADVRAALFHECEVVGFELVVG